MSYLLANSVLLAFPALCNPSPHPGLQSRVTRPCSSFHEALTSSSRVIPPLLAPLQLMAICEHYQLWSLVERRVQRFLSSEAERSKAQAPSLGALLPLLALSRRHDWRDVLPVVLGEAQDRSILWICKHDPSLEKRLQRAPEAPADAALLRGAWEGNKVGVRGVWFCVWALGTCGRLRLRLGWVLRRTLCHAGTFSYVFTLGSSRAPPLSHPRLPWPAPAAPAAGQQAAVPVPRRFPGACGPPARLLPGRSHARHRLAVRPAWRGSEGGFPKGCQAHPGGGVI